MYTRKNAGSLWVDSGKVCPSYRSKIALTSSFIPRYELRRQDKFVSLWICCLDTFQWKYSTISSAHELQWKCPIFLFLLNFWIDIRNSGRYIAQNLNLKGQNMQEKFVLVNIYSNVRHNSVSLICIVSGTFYYKWSNVFFLFRWRPKISALIDSDIRDRGAFTKCRHLTSDRWHKSLRMSKTGHASQCFPIITWLIIVGVDKSIYSQPAHKQCLARKADRVIMRKRFVSNKLQP